MKPDKQIIFLVAFCIACLVLGFSAMYPGYMPDLLAKNVETLVATSAAAWAGGWAAFRAERNTQEINKRNSRLSYANKAIFQISQAYEMMENLRRYYIVADNWRNDPDRALKMNSPQPGMMARIEFNFDELSFLLDQKGDAPAALQALMIFDWQLRVLHETIEQRARAREQLELVIQQIPALAKSAEAIRGVAHVPYAKLEAHTDQMIESVDSGLITAIAVYGQLQAICAEIILGQTILRVNFAGQAVKRKAAPPAG